MAKEKKETLRVTVGGKEFTRTTHRVYTHVLVGRRDRAKHWAAATGWTQYEEDTLRRSFRHAQETADGSWWVKNGFTFKPDNPTDRGIQESGRRVVALGLDGYRKEVQAREIERFHEQDARGDFETKVISWHAGLKNAQAALKTAANRGYYSALRLVEIPADRS